MVDLIQGMQVMPTGDTTKPLMFALMYLMVLAMLTGWRWSWRRRVRMHCKQAGHVWVTGDEGLYCNHCLTTPPYTR